MPTEIESLRKRAEEAEADADRLHAELTALRSDLADRTRDVEAQTARIDSLTKATGMQRAELELRDKKIASLAAQLVEKDAKIGALGRELEAAQVELERLRTEANEEIASLRSQLEL